MRTNSSFPIGSGSRYFRKREIFAVFMARISGQPFVFTGMQLSLNGQVHSIV
jgi:hypothetical protein